MNCPNGQQNKKPQQIGAPNKDVGKNNTNQDSSGGGEKKRNAKQGRRRRGKRDVILDFSKRIKKPGTYDVPAPELKLNKRSRGKGGNSKHLALTTSSKDYDGQLELPEQVSQRKYESTGQFFRRLDRLVAKARVEANLKARFDLK